MTTLCGDCQWFETKIRFGRDSKSCQDLGEDPTGETCDRFMKKPKAGQSTVEWIEDQVGSLENVRYRDVFHEILAEGFVLEQDAKLAVANIKAQLQIQGAQVVLEGKEFERSVSRLIDLYQVYRLVCALGLARFIDEIMDAEIQRRFLLRPQIPLSNTPVVSASEPTP